MNFTEERKCSTTSIRPFNPNDSGVEYFFASDARFFFKIMHIYLLKINIVRCVAQTNVLLIFFFDFSIINLI